MEVEIISKRTIRPSTPTPHHQKNFKLSLLDQTYPPYIYINHIYFYNPNHNGTDLAYSQLSNISIHLQESLSKTLVHYYPLAGRLKDAVTIDCNDEGAHFVVAQINCSLFDFLSQVPEPNFLHHFNPTPTDPKTTHLASSGRVVLAVQLTHFNCGGIAIAVSSSHKVLDAQSVCTFLQSWTATARGDRIGVLPEFMGPSLLPPSPSDMPVARTLEFPLPGENLATRRFVFSISKMESLKAKTSILVQHLGISKGPTNVELLTAFVLKCAISASQTISSSAGRSFRPLLLSQAVNLRNRMVPPVPENAIGNLVWGFGVFIERNDIELHELVAKMRKEFRDFCDKEANRFKGEEGLSVVSESHEKEVELRKMGVNVISCTSLFRFPFYDMDFGWGKPIWVTFCPMYPRKFIYLVGTKWGKDHIEALVTLEEQEMAIFERDEVLLSFASLNPSPLIVPVPAPIAKL